MGKYLDWTEQNFGRLLTFWGRCSLAGIVLFLVVTVIESETDFLSNMAARSWSTGFARLPAGAAQGVLSAKTISAIVHYHFQHSRMKALVMGDSILGPDYGGMTVAETSPGEVFSAKLPGVLNIALGSSEWGVTSLLMSHLRKDPEVRNQRPALIVNFNYKFFTTPTSYTPHFPIEIPLCSSVEFTRDAEMKAVCDTLAVSWKSMALAKLGALSPELLDGVLGQMDFFLTYFQRTQIYMGFSVKGYGRFPFRSFYPAIVDAKLSSKYLEAHPAVLFTPHYPKEIVPEVERYVDWALKGFFDPAHPKQIWMRGLAKSIEQWPGPVYIIVNRVSPSIEQDAISAVQLEKLKQVERQTFEYFGKTGREDVKIVSIRDIAPDPQDYIDMDHLSVQGHQKLANWARGVLQ